MPGFDYGAPVAVRRRDLAEVMIARVEELLGLVRSELAQSGYAEILPAGAVITGGGSRMTGLGNLASDILNMPVTLGKPQALWGLDDELRTPEFSTGIGLVQTAFHDENLYGFHTARAQKESALGRIGSWMRSVITPAAR